MSARLPVLAPPCRYLALLARLSSAVIVKPSGRAEASPFDRPGSSIQPAARARCSPTARARGGGTAFPTCRYC